MLLKFRIEHEDPGHTTIGVFVAKEARSTAAKAGVITLTNEEARELMGEVINHKRVPAAEARS